MLIGPSLAIPAIQGPKFIGAIEPTALLAPFALTRSQAGGVSSTVLRGGVWSEFAADTARFDDNGLLIGGQGINLNTNPRGEGGSGTTWPTGWAPSVGGLAVTSITQNTRNGVQGVDVRFAGTPSSTAVQSLVTGSVDAVAIGTTVANQVWTGLVGGTLTNVSQFTLRCQTEAGGTAYTLGSVAQATNIRTTTGTNSSTQLRWNYNDTVTPVDFTIFIGWPDRKHSAVISTPVLPPVGSPAASTRGADLVNATLASLGLPASGAGTWLFRVLLPQAAPSGSPQVIFQIDDGTTSNRYVLRNQAGALSIAILRVTAGVASSVTTPGTMTAGTPFSVAVTLDGAGGMKASMSGGAVVAQTGGPTSGLTTARVGNDTAGTLALFGSIIRAAYTSQVYTDAQLQAASAAFV